MTDYRCTGRSVADTLNGAFAALYRVQQKLERLRSAASNMDVSDASSAGRARPVDPVNDRELADLERAYEAALEELLHPSKTGSGHANDVYLQ